MVITLDDKLIHMLENSQVQEIEVDQNLVLNIVSKIERKKILNELKLSIFFVGANILFSSIVIVYMMINNILDKYLSWFFFLYILPVMLYSVLYVVLKSNISILKRISKLEV